MYCIKCGVQLADTEQKCPLCNTVVYHPEIQRPTTPPLYPVDKMPKAGTGRRALSGLIIIIFLIPMIICLFSDIQHDFQLDWFGFIAGAIMIVYIALPLPLWFRKPNPVIFVPCNFVAIGLYLLYIDLATNGNWFLEFALPIVIGAAVIVCTVVTLLRYVHRGRLYIFGGASMALGVLNLMIELLMVRRFPISFIGWSIYPLIVLFLLGSTAIYLAINRSAREVMKRKLFF